VGKLLRRPQAVRDLYDIWGYIAQNNADAADRLLRLFDEKLRLLSEAPGIGKAREDLSPGLRSFVVGDYTAVLPDRAGRNRLIAALHGRRNIDLMAELGLFDEPD